MSSPDPSTPIGTTLGSRRRRLGLDQASLAELAGVSRHTVSNIERGIGNPTLSVLTDLCLALGLELRLEVRTTGTTP